MLEAADSEIIGLIKPSADAALLQDGPAEGTRRCGAASAVRRRRGLMGGGVLLAAALLAAAARG